MPESTQFMSGLKAGFPVKGKGAAAFLFRLLRAEDAPVLTAFFASLSEETKTRFGPHPLDAQTAVVLCNSAEEDPADRFVLADHDMIAGYFILDPLIPLHEAERYRGYGIKLQDNKDCMFAPCIADAYQDQGLAGVSMNYILRHCRLKDYRSLVLLGGTQESNPRAIHFYEKFGFELRGGYQTGVWNRDMRLIFK